MSESKRAGRLRVALVSMMHRDGDVDFNLERHFWWLERAEKTAARFIGFPEFSMTGWVNDPAQAITLDAPQLKELESYARRRRVYLATGFVEKRRGRRYNASAVFGPRGRVGVMHKVNPVPKELEHYTPGREFPVFDVGGCRMGIATCADASNYEMFHVLSLLGAEVIFAPHANSLGAYGQNAPGWARWRMERWPVFVRDACVSVIGVNCAGLPARPKKDDQLTKYCGGSMVMNWKGEVLASAPVRNRRECIIAADVDVKGLREARAKRGGSFQSATFYPHLFR